MLPSSLRGGLADAVIQFQRVDQAQRNWIAALPAVARNNVSKSAHRPRKFRRLGERLEPLRTDFFGLAIPAP